ncbi:hypothetical protein EDE08_12244 [Bradyrhizobium sp. R2.2-H]|nr:hypothetical protein EDE10_12144 [Bradyrhizobium sp. Y-H1]TCU64490.1 hypothetical protein EDE08_12244 [Bradyrhizobium sp. R2.2-H]
MSSADELPSCRAACLKRDAIRMNRHRALGYCLSMIFSENRCTLFRIMLYRRSNPPSAPRTSVRPIEPPSWPPTDLPILAAIPPIT